MGLLNLNLNLNLNFNSKTSFNADFLKDSILNTETANFRDLLTSNNRFIAIEGGRGGTKSSHIADYLIYESFLPELKGTNFLCIREFKSSIKYSSYSMIKARITKHNLEKKFTCKANEIINKETGITFYFMGIQDPAGIAGLVNISRAWGDECHKMELKSLEVVIPTIRRLDGKPTKLYFTWNKFKTVDDIEAYIKRQKNYSISQINITDLPSEYQNQDLLDEMESDKKYNPDLYAWKWLGAPYPSRAIEPFINMAEVDFSKREYGGEVYAFIDPSFMGVDTTALTICWRIGNGEKLQVFGKVWHRAWYDCMQETIELLTEFNVEHAYYEDNAIKGVIQRDYRNLYDINILPHNNSKSKVDRIFRVASYANYIELLADNRSYMYNRQVKEYNADKTQKNKAGYYDDAPDSLASCLMKMGIIK